MGYKIKDWAKFQHFKDRRPPWIKLYRDILDDPEWHELAPAAAKTMVMLWLIASEDSGNLPDIKRIAFRLRLPISTIQAHISALSHWLICDDITTISGRYQDDAPERETEGEGEKETERETDKPRKAADYSDPPFPECLESVAGFREAWDGWMESRTAKRHRATTKARAILLKRLAERPTEAVHAVETATARDWTGFEWAWMEGKDKSTARETFAERIEREGRARLAERQKEEAGQ